ncbi:MAG: phosphoribosylformylglycinamidine synthase subunit PurL [Candidatus Atribacteria bacterium]|nr:phosphoribosylformylglycinamidine synthase subunit PurL [Candidatus Atribacteria bacterium]
MERISEELGLRKEEYQKVVEILGRVPTPTEIAMFSVEWSEHCGYPHSRRWFELFPRQGHFPALFGEDAGGIIYDDLAIIFKMESHNHPSQIEPKQGAATGIGGVIRDILGSGARPIACFDSLRFGPLEDRNSRYVFRGVVEGIAFYGNCVGVPTVGGELYFHPAFRGNCLVNVMCVGVAEKGKLAQAVARGEGNIVLYVGNKTGRDGIGGCSILASQEFADGEEKRPSVQIGDPFTEKCLIEATLEALATGFVVGVKDMGAAGLTCSASEMAAAGKSGVELDLDRVPLREEGMEAWEIMMSESQERMLLCVARGREEEIRKIFKKWGLEAEIVGKVTGSGRVTIIHRGEVVADIPANELTAPPVYTPPRKRPTYLDEVNSLSLQSLPLPTDYENVVLTMLSSPNLCSRRWVYEQYDHMVQTNTVVLPGKGASVLRVKGKKWGIAVTTDCNPVYCYLDPYRGAQMAVAEAALNLSACGARPAGITDCLNFGNPEKPDRYWQFVEAVKGIADASRFFGLPIVSGNVSFYNENPRGTIYPVPTIGMVGIIEDVEQAVDGVFKEEGHIVVLLGKVREELGGSEYLRVIHNLEAGPLPSFSLNEEKALQELLIELISGGFVVSASDVSEGGLLFTLLEACLAGECPLGVMVNVEPWNSLRMDAVLFGEGRGRVLLSLREENYSKVAVMAQEKGVPFAVLGRVGGRDFLIRNGREVLVALPVLDLKERWESVLS